MGQLVPRLLLLLSLGQLALTMNFNYGLFENFVVSEKVFKEELMLKERLIKLKEDLVKWKREYAEPISEAQQMDEELLGKFADYMKAASNSSQLLSDFDSQTKTFGGQKSFSGALRGLLILKETYRLPVEDITSGVLNLFSPSSQKLEVFKSRHTLNTHDMVDLAGTAIMDGWIDDAVDLTKVGMAMLEKSGELESKSVPEWLKEHLRQLPKMKSMLPRIQNELLEKRRAIVGQDFKLLPFAINEQLERSETQPEYLGDVLAAIVPSEENMKFGGDIKEYKFRSVCRRHRIGGAVRSQEKFTKCSYLHHNDPFLRLGPFKMELLLYEPFRMIYHDIFSEEEMRWMKEYSTPKLSQARGKSEVNEKFKRNTKDPKIHRIIHKTIQVWLKDKEYDDPVMYTQIGEGRYMQDEFEEDLQKGKVVMPVMRKLGRKIELATSMEVLARFASTEFQVTNYGLGGLCETHIDPLGAMEGAYVDAGHQHLVSTGDMIATFMGWLEDVPAGGETGFDLTGYSQAVSPQKGSAAFWIDLERSGKRELRSSHGGCPVAVGSKWILNKWMYYYDQFKTFPCGLDFYDQFRPFKGVY